LKQAKGYDSSLVTKSGFMLGFGETHEELLRTFRDLIESDCNMLTLGQYLQPSSMHLPVERYIPPQEFNEWHKTAMKMGFSQVAGGPFVRSSYHAGNLYRSVTLKNSDRL
jgi:lipoyl synthase